MRSPIASTESSAALLLACGDGAALSHRSAAALWDLLHGPLMPIEVTVPRDGGRKRDRIIAHRMALADTDTVVWNGIRVTTPARTIVDLAGTLNPRALRETVERAQDMRRFRPREIRSALQRAPLPRARAARRPASA